MLKRLLIVRRKLGQLFKRMKTTSLFYLMRLNLILKSAIYSFRIRALIHANHFFDLELVELKVYQTKNKHFDATYRFGVVFSQKYQ